MAVRKKDVGMNAEERKRKSNAGKNKREKKKRAAQLYMRMVTH